jgi:hypothetical protein
MGAHQDDREEDLSKPVVSLSFGPQSAVFLLGGETRAVRPSAFVLADGDVVVLSGPARLAFHGVPRVFSDGGGDDDDDDDAGAGAGGGGSGSDNDGRRSDNLGSGDDAEDRERGNQVTGGTATVEFESEFGSGIGGGEGGGGGGGGGAAAPGGGQRRRRCRGRKCGSSDDLPSDAEAGRYPARRLCLSVGGASCDAQWRKERLLRGRININVRQVYADD